MFTFTVHPGRITDMDAVVNPDKLGHLDLDLDWGEEPAPGVRDGG